MFFKPGVSGFVNIRNLVYIENDKLDDDNHKFKQVCFSIANTGLFKVKSFDLKPVSKSFYTVNIEKRSEHIYILLNTSYSYICFASSVDYFNITYIDDSALEKVFNKHYRVLKVSDLITPICQKEENQLHEMEITQLKYYNSQTIGDVIFNFWD